MGLPKLPELWQVIFHYLRPEDAAIDFDDRRYGDVNGAIIATEKLKLLRARPASQTSHHDFLYLDLASHLVGGAPQDGRWTSFLEWNVYAGSPGQWTSETRPLIHFKVTTA